MAFNYKTEYDRYRRYYQSLEPILKRREARNYSTAIFSFLAVSLFAWYGIRPTMQTILFLRREIADNTTVSQQMEDKITHLVEAQAIYQNTADKLSAVDDAFPQDPNVLNLVSQIRNLANTTGSSISALQVATLPLLPSIATVGAVPITGKPTSVPLVVVVNGPYTVLKAFLDGLLGMRRILTIDTMNIAPSKEEVSTIASTSGTMLRMVLRLNGYYMIVKKGQ